MNRLILVLIAAVLVGCGASAPERKAETMSDTERLASILAAQPDAMKARYPHRNPDETLAFFGVKPGMTVVEGLPGSGWYSVLLTPYLGSRGMLIGADYPVPMYEKFGIFPAEFIAQKRTWTTDWPASIEQSSEGTVKSDAFVFGALPNQLEGTADVVLMIRAFHNLARFDAEDGTLDTALADLHAVLKPGGVLGVVQHEARADMPDDWASGGNGYLKREWLVKRIEAAGFALEASSPINQNPNDQPTANDMVWRLPPSLVTSGEDAELRAEMEAIGESNRMTLRFRKT